jgi:hypothetical protein
MHLAAEVVLLLRERQVIGKAFCICYALSTKSARLRHNIVEHEVPVLNYNILGYFAE